MRLWLVMTRFFLYTRKYVCVLEWRSCVGDAGSIMSESPTLCISILPLLRRCSFLSTIIITHSVTVEDNNVDGDVNFLHISFYFTCVALNSKLYRTLIGAKSWYTQQKHIISIRCEKENWTKNLFCIVSWLNNYFRCVFCCQLSVFFFHFRSEFNFVYSEFRFDNFFFPTSYRSRGRERTLRSSTWIWINGFLPVSIFSSTIVVADDSGEVQFVFSNFTHFLGNTMITF